MDLKAYINNYLKKEIQSETLTRNLPEFSKFWPVRLVFDTFQFLPKSSKPKFMIGFEMAIL